MIISVLKSFVQIFHLQLIYKSNLYSHALTHSISHKVDNNFIIREIHNSFMNMLYFNVC